MSARCSQSTRSEYGEQLAQVLVAVFLDLALGDPENALHPVSMLGGSIARLERFIYPLDSGYPGGVLLTSCALAVSAAVSASVTRLAARGGRLGRLIGGSLLIYHTLSLKSLAKAAGEVETLLGEGRLEDARNGVARMVGRDTGSLDTPEIVRAAVESVAENASDGVVAPLLYAVVGGPLLAVLYRTVNTLDSMVGYRNERYARFGSASARLDDLLNLVPARLTAAALLAAGTLRGGSPSQMAGIVWRDARGHESPNAGWPESAMAAALGVRLGGTNYYGGRRVFCEHMGEAERPLDPAVIGEAVECLRMAATVVAGLLLLMSLAAKRLNFKK